MMNYSQVADGSTRRCIKLNRDVSELVFNPVQLILKILSRKPSLFLKNLTDWRNESLQCCCHTTMHLLLKLFWSLTIFTLLYLPWDPKNFVGNKNDCFYLRSCQESQVFLKKSDWLTWWVFTVLLSHNNSFTSEAFVVIANVYLALFAMRSL